MNNVSDPADASGAAADAEFQVQSVADQVYAVLRERIAEGEIERGSRLHQEDLAKEFGVSRTPVREALRRLAAEGLVDLFANRGARVATATDEQLRSSYETRLVVEPGAARVAATLQLERADRRDARGDARRGEGRAVTGQALPRQPRLSPGAGRGHRQPAARRSSWSTSGSAGSARRSTRRASTPSGLKADHDAHRSIAEAIETGDGERAERAQRAAISSGRWSCCSSTPLSSAQSRGVEPSPICSVFSSE